MSEPSYWITCTPGVVVSTIILAVSGVLGGPIAAAIAAMAVLPSLLLACVLSLIVLHRYMPATRARAVALGSCLYVGAAVMVLAVLAAFGPTQIM